MTITAIKQQVKNPERASIFVDGKYSFSLSLDELVAEKLKHGQEIDQPRLKALQKISDEGKAKFRTLNWLLLRPHSVKEFRDYLRRKKADPELIEAWEQQFLAKKYLDDEAFAKWWVESRRAGKRSSNRKLQLELRQKGIDQEIIKEVLDDSEEDERAALCDVIAKTANRSRYKNDPVKFMQYLLRQGFNYGMIKEELNRD